MPHAWYFWIQGQNDWRARASSEGRSGRGVEMTRNNMALWKPVPIAVSSSPRSSVNRDERACSARGPCHPWRREFLEKLSDLGRGDKIDLGLLAIHRGDWRQ